MPAKQSANYWLNFLNVLFDKDEFKLHFDKNKVMLMSLNVTGLYKLAPTETASKEFFSRLPTDIKIKFLKKYQETSSYEPAHLEFDAEPNGLLRGISLENQSKVLKDYFFTNSRSQGQAWLETISKHIEDGSIFGLNEVAQSPVETSIAPVEKEKEKSNKGSVMTDSEHLVIGQHKTTIESGMAFYKIIGQISPKVKFFNRAEAVNMYPGSGEMVVNAKLASHPHKDDSLVCWVLGEPDPSHTSQYSAIRQGSEHRIYQIFPISLKITQVDQVREVITDFYSRNTGRNHLFRTVDGYFIRPNFPPSPVIENSFNLPLEVYRKLKTYPTTEFGEIAWDFTDAKLEKVNFIAATKLLKRFLKILDVKEKIKKVGLTKDLVSSLTDDLEKFGEEGLDPTDLDRVKDLLDNIAGHSDAAEELGEFILQSPEFKHQLDEYKKNSKMKIEQELADIKNEILLKQEEKSRVEKALASATQAHQKSVKAFEADVAKKFKEAVSKGKEVLVETALFQALLSNQGSTTEPDIAAEPQQISLPDPAIQIRTIKDFSRQIEPFADTLQILEAQHCAAFLGALMGCKRVVIDSDSPSRLSQVISSAFFGGVYLDVSLPGDVFSISDVLNLPSNLRGSSAGPITLAQALDQLAICERPILLSVKGMNRAPEGIVLEEMSEWVSQSRKGGLEISFSNPKKIIEKAKLPKDLFILYFVDHGETSIPISAKVLAQLPLFSIPAPSVMNDDTDNALLTAEAMDEIAIFTRDELRLNAPINKGSIPITHRLSVNSLISKFSSLAGIEVDDSTLQNVFVSETYLAPQNAKILKDLVLHAAATDSPTQKLFDLLSNKRAFK